LGGAVFPYPTSYFSRPDVSLKDSLIFGANFNDYRSFNDYLFGCPENRYGSCQVHSENGYSETPTIATRQNAQSPKVAYIKHFRAN